MYAGISVKVLISSSKINEISTEGVYLDLLMHDGIVSSNPIIHCGELFSGVIVVLNAPFSYQLRGYDSKGTVWRKILTGENIDEFDEFPAIRQYFPYQNFSFS